jgi:enhancing lycopene biosynthesis protein 2
MAKRVGVILSGCGHRDGTEIHEAALTMVSLDRAGAEIICAAPDVTQPRVVDHLNGDRNTGEPRRRALVEAARIARFGIRPLSALDVRDVDALVFPGGEGVGLNLSNWAEKGEVCEVNPDVARLLRGCLPLHKPMGFICLAPLLAARILGPIAGVRITLGPRGTVPSRHAAVMGADVRPCTANDLVIDQKNMVISTPAFMYEDARLRDVAAGIDKLVRTLMSMTRDRAASPQPSQTTAQATRPAPPPPAAKPPLQKPISDIDPRRRSPRREPTPPRNPR